MEGENKYSFIVIGKKGAGNSSILNSLVGEERFPEGGELTTITKEVCGYVGKLKYDNSTFAIIDTPVFLDSDNEDINHIKNIIKFMKNLKEFGAINCIFYVISLGERRFDHTIQTCLSLLKTLLGDDVFKMIKFIYTMKNEISRKSYVNALERFKDLPELLKTSGFPVNDNVEIFIYDYDEPEDFCRKIITCTKQSPKFSPEVLQHLKNINFDQNDPVNVYENLIDNSECISSLNDQLNILEEGINIYSKQSQKFEEEKKLFAMELRRKKEEMNELLEAHSIEMIQSQIDQLNIGHINAINQMREANELQNERLDVLREEAPYVLYDGGVCTIF